MEKTLVIIKPDALQRNLLGDIISRFEKKGLKIIGLKMMKINDVQIKNHYAHHLDKPFFKSLKKFMQSSPVIMMVLEGLEAVKAVRLITGPTVGRKAEAGSIRGDFAMSAQCNIVHASDSLETAQKEIARFFKPEELFDYEKMDFCYIYAEDERKCFIKK